MNGKSDNSGNDKVTFKYILGIAGAIILLLLSISSTLTLLGIKSMQTGMLEMNKDFKEKFKGLHDEVSQKNDAGEKRDMEAMRERGQIKDRVQRLEILITMNHNDRMKALERLQKIINHGQSER
jgi:hypothetical protein